MGDRDFLYSAHELKLQQRAIKNKISSRMQNLLSSLDGGQEQFIWVQTKDLGLTMPTSLFDLFLEERTEMKERASNYGFNTWMKEYQKKEKKEKDKKNKVKQSDHDRKHAKSVSSSTTLLVGGSSGSGSSSGSSSSSGTSASTLATLSGEQSATVTVMKHSDGKFSSMTASSSLKAVATGSPVTSSSSSSSSSNSQSDQERELFAQTYRTMLEALQFKSQMVEYLSLAAKPLKGSDTPIFNIMVPGYSSLPAVNYGNHASLIVKSLYPHCPGRPYREGDPICDAAAVSLYENRIVCCSTDGCNWGEHPRKASRRANKNFMRYVQTYQSSIKSILDAVYFLTAALADSHLAIIHNSDDLRSGSTTIMGGILLEIDKTGAVSSSGSGSGSSSSSSSSSGAGSSGGSGGNNPGTELYDKPNWVFVSVSLGDCKAFRVSKNGLVFDLSEESRNDPFDVTDPGGRLGVHAGEPKPDLRSLFAFWSPVDEGDVISLMSDGISDNLDPQIHGLMPPDLGVDVDNWSNLSRGLGSILKSEYVKNYITEKIVPTEPSFITPNTIAHGLMSNALSVTEHHRNYLSQNPSLKAPSDYSLFPGKLDHASVVSFRVGYVSKAPITSLPSVSREAVAPRPFLDDSSSTLSSVPNDLNEKKRRISFSVSSNVVLANTGGSSPPSSPFSASPAAGKFMGRSASEQGTFPGRIHVRPSSTAPSSSSPSGSGPASASQEVQSSPTGWVSISGATRGRRSSIRLTDKKPVAKRDSSEEKIEQPSDKSSEPPAEN